MTTPIRFIASVPAFREAGLNITDKWQTVDVDSLTPDQRDLLEQTTGTIVMVHEDDQEKWASASGLEFHDGKLRYPDGKQPEGEQPIGKRNATTAARKAVTATATSTKPSRASASSSSAEPDASTTTADRPLPDNIASGRTPTRGPKG